MAKKKNDIEELFKRLAPWVGGVQSAVPSPWQAQAPVIPQQYGQPRELSAQPMSQQSEQPVFRDEISQGNNGAPGMWNETTGQINPTKPVDPRLEQSGTGKMQPSSWGQKIQPIQEDWNGNLITVGKDYTGEWLSSKDGKITKYGTRAEAVAAGGDYYQPNFIYHPTQQGQGNYQQKFQEPYRQQPRQPMGSSGPIPVNPLG